VGAANVALAVVYPEWRVIGAGALRFVGASIFPRSADGNIDPLTVMTIIDVFNE